MEKTTRSAIRGKASPTGGGLERVLGGLLFLGVFLLYAIKAPDFAVPGRWAGMLSTFLGLEPVRPLVRPLWSALMSMVALVPPERAAHVVNLLSAVLGAVVSWLLFTIVRHIPFDRTRHLDDRWAVERWPRLWAGLFAGLIGAVCFPLMTVATQGDYYVLDAVLLLLPLWPAAVYQHRPVYRLVVASFAAFGLGLAEYPILALLLPVFFLWWTWHLWRNRHLRSWLAPVSVVLMFATTAVIMAVFSAWGARELTRLEGSPVTWGVAWHTYLKLYGLEMVRSVPKVGWLLLMGTCVVPLIFTVFRPLEEPQDLYSRLGVYSFRFILILLGVATLFELPGSPSRLLGSQVMVVTPYLVAAIWFGHLLGYFYGLTTRAASRIPRILLASGTLAVVLAAGVVNFRATTFNALKPVVQFAQEVVAGLKDRAFLLTEGTLDASLRLAIREAGLPVRIINIRNENPQYAALVAGYFPDAERKDAAHLGMRPLLQEWMNDPDRLAREVALLTAPSVMSPSGLALVPAGCFYLLAKPESVPAPEVLLEQNRAAWARRAVVHLESLSEGDAGWFQLQFIRRWSSRLANDLGVFLDDRDLPDLASSGYEQALAFWPDNLSASFNLLARAQREQDAEQETAWTARIKQQAERNPDGLNPGFMRQVSGMVRNPMLNFESGSQLVRTGQRAEAMSQAERMAGLLDGQEPNAQVELARLFLRGNRTEQAEQVLREVLAREPDHQGAHLGLLQVALVRRNLEEAEQLLQRLETLGLAPDRLALERAGLDLMAGRTAEARKRYLELVKKPAPPAEAWFGLARLALQQKDQPLLEEAVTALKKERSYLPGLVLLGELAVQQRNIEEARRLFDRVVALDPANVVALGRLAQMDFDRRDAQALRQRAAALLTADPDNAMGHYFAATVHLAAERYELAETALRKSLAQREYDGALNDLAWLLNRRGQSEEALTLARRALELNPAMANFWDTLADIQHTRRDRTGTLEALAKALQLSDRKDVPILLHATRLYAELGEAAEAQACLSVLASWMDRLPAATKAEVEQLRQKLPGS